MAGSPPGSAARCWRPPNCSRRASRSSPETISLEEGKPLAESRGEVGRCPDLLRLSAFEGAQLRGEVLPLDAAPNGAGKLGLAMRVPCGVVVAITPFNFPLLLVLHKLAPALAAGNAVILKPASATPLVALKLTELHDRGGIPAAGVAVRHRQRIDARRAALLRSARTEDHVHGVDRRRRADHACSGHQAPVARARRERPGRSAADGDIEAAAAQTALGGYANAGQVCISTQRVIVERAIYADFLDALAPQVEAIRPGDPMKDGTRLSAMITEDEAERVQRWIAEAVADGARVVAGGECDGAVHAATLVTDVDPSMRIFREELFGPAVAVTAVADPDDALRLANQTSYGLTAGVFTKDLDTALKHASMLEAGVVYINAAPPWRADLMPYGGIKQSGIGTEGPRYAVQEMTEVRTVVFNQH